MSLSQPGFDESPSYDGANGTVQSYHKSSHMNLPSCREVEPHIPLDDPRPGHESLVHVGITDLPFPVEDEEGCSLTFSNPDSPNWRG